MGVAGLGRMYAGNLTHRCSTARFAAVFDLNADAARESGEQLRVPWTFRAARRGRRGGGAGALAAFDPAVAADRPWRSGRSVRVKPAPVEGGIVYEIEES